MEVYWCIYPDRSALRIVIMVDLPTGQTAESIIHLHSLKYTLISYRNTVLINPIRIKCNEDWLPEGIATILLTNLTYNSYDELMCRLYAKFAWLIMQPTSFLYLYYCDKVTYKDTCMIKEERAINNKMADIPGSWSLNDVCIHFKHIDLYTIFTINISIFTRIYVLLP